MKPEAPLKVLLELRPALDGYAGIPQETRLLFRGLCLLSGVAPEGLLQTSLRFLSAGMATPRDSEANIEAGAVVAQYPSESARLHCYSQVVMSVNSKPSGRAVDQIRRYFKRRITAWVLTFRAFLQGRTQVETTIFEARFFENFVWEAMFAKTLHADDFDLVTAKDFRVCTVPWNVLQSAGLNSLKLRRTAVYPTLDTADIDVFITQTPYPAQVGANTKMVVRYHDALPILMPQAFANMWRHQATHYNALVSNVESGAFFACVSEATRQDLISIFPELEERAVTIHNMVSHHFFEENSPASRVSEIVRARENLTISKTRSAINDADGKPATHPPVLSKQDNLAFRYVLMVSTIEPRKNHSLLIAAWESIRLDAEPPIKLIIVGSLGWDTGPILEQMRPWVDSGDLFFLSSVPATDLRVLYRHADVTVCPSLAEGFDYSGVECMRSGGVVIASDIGVHREIYAEAAAYFAPRSVKSLVSRLREILFAPDLHALRERLRDEGRKVSTRYLPENILPQWDVFLQDVAKNKKTR